MKKCFSRPFLALSLIAASGSSGCSSKVPAAAAKTQEIENTNQKIADEQVYMVVEEMPQFPGGESAMREFFNKNMIYPKEAREKNEEGRVIVEFIVTQNGAIKNAQIVRSVSESIDKEALRIINLMPRWTPGKQNGRPVSVRFVVPLTFSLGTGND